MRHGRGLLVSGGVLLLITTAAGAQGTETEIQPSALREAVPIRTPTPPTPIATAGTGLAPAVAVRLAIDERGRVRGVTVLRITPASPYDELFRAAAVQTAREWRYAPRIVDGAAVPTELESTLQFLPLEESGARGEDPLVWRRQSRPEAAAAELGRTLTAMERAQRAAHLEGVGTFARNHLDGERMRKVGSGRFVVYTDTPSSEMADLASSTLEATYAALDRLLARHVPPEPEPYKTLAFVYARADAFTRLAGQVAGLEHGQGFYYPAGLIATHAERPSSRDVIATLMHHATHSYLDRYVTRPGVVLPSWLVEGFADYVARSEIREGSFVPGRLQGTGAIAAGQAIPLADLIAAEREDFSGEQRRMYDTLAWALVHFMRHGREEWSSEERFPRWMLYVAEGYPPSAAFHEVYGDPAGLAAAFQSYVERP